MANIKLPSKRKKKKKQVSNNIYGTIRKKYVQFRDRLNQIQDIQQEAFDRMFEFGELLIKNTDRIKEDYGTWGEFAEEEGLDYSTVSRCRASVKDFKAHGANSLDEARKLLKKRGWKPSAKIMERNINRLLTDADRTGRPEPPKDKSIKREKHINELHSMQERASEIMAQHDPDDDLYQEAAHVTEFVKDTVGYMQTLDISQKEWNSKLFLDFCRNINFDVVIGEPVESTEPHHISPRGDHGSQGAKVADMFAIPVSRDTHNKLHKDEISLTEDEISDCHRWTMAMFIFNTISSDMTPTDISSMEEAESTEV